MINSTTEYFFAGLFGVCFIGALLSGDRKVRYGFLILFSSWVFYTVIRWTLGSNWEFFAQRHWEVTLEVAINFYVIVSFFLLAGRSNSKQFFSRWTNAVLMIELMIFVSHFTHLFLGWKIKIQIINYFFAAEIILVTIVASARTWGRIKKIRQYFKSRGLFRSSAKVAKKIK